MNNTNIASQLDTLRPNVNSSEGFGEESGFSLRSILQILSRRWLVFSVVSVAVCAFQVSNILKRPPIYQESFSLLVQPPEQDITNPLPGASGANSNGGIQMGDYYDTQISILMGNKLLTPVLKKIYQKYPFLNDYNFGYNGLLRQMFIRRQNEGQILIVNYQDQDPERVQFVLQQLADTYLKYTQNDQRNKTEEKLEFVNQQIPILQKQVLFLQTELLKLQQKYNFYNPEKQGDFHSTTLNTTLEKKGEVKLQITQTQNMVKMLEKQLNVTESQAIALDTLSQSPQYMQLVSRLNEINLELAKQSTRFTDDNLLVQQLRAERE
ncbi:MAG: GumC family protein, partial [Microcystaceae cyanobacterium]